MEKSVINKRWVEEVSKHSDIYTVHKLYEVYPDEKIDVEKGKKLVEAHGDMVLQFPIQWFSFPSLLKKWLNEVLTYGWAFGTNGGNKLKNRKVALAVTAGIKESDYC